MGQGAGKKGRGTGEGEEKKEQAWDDQKIKPTPRNSSQVNNHFRNLSLSERILTKDDVGDDKRKYKDGQKRQG